MRWRIPAKTFLLGEYAALAGASAILLTTFPCFELFLVDDDRLENIHPKSPAGQWWRGLQLQSKGLSWIDPYQGLGGLGASSAQFLGAYLASCSLLDIEPNKSALLDAYYQYSWEGNGLKPSGYDLLAQTANHCVYINQQKQVMRTYDWVFKDLSFLLLHSGKKLATHEHLINMKLPHSIRQLSDTVELAHQAFRQKDSEQLVQAVLNYEEQLATLGLVAPHCQKFIHSFKAQDDVLAAKGCGALGADVILLIVPSDVLKTKTKKLIEEGWTVLATSENLYSDCALIENNTNKTLEILP